MGYNKKIVSSVGLENILCGFLNDAIALLILLSLTVN